MLRYIDADKLIEAFNDYPFGDSITPQGAIEIIDGFADASGLCTEDTGFTPEEIKALQADNERLHELVDIIERTIKAL